MIQSQEFRATSGVPVSTLMLDKFISFCKMAAGMAPIAPPTATDVPNGTPEASRKRQVAMGALHAHVAACGVRAGRNAPFP